MNKSNKLTITLTGASLGTGLLYSINKLAFFTSTYKGNLYSDNSNFYNWRLGKIFYTKKGNKNPPILLIHDLDCTSSDYEWREVINKFSENHTVYTIDLLGFGRSEKPKLTYTGYLYVQLISDFIKNVIKHNTDIIATGASASIAIMTCFTDNRLIKNILLVNPCNLQDICKYPHYYHKIFRHLIDFPILGTSIYNLVTSRFNIKRKFKNYYFYNKNNIKPRYIKGYNEAAHIGGSPAKFIYSSICCHYTNVNLIHALKTINNNLCIIGGEHENLIQNTIQKYIEQNNSIESTIISKSKHLPQLENPKEFVKQCNIFLN